IQVNIGRIRKVAEHCYRRCRQDLRGSGVGLNLIHVDAAADAEQVDKAAPAKSVDVGYARKHDTVRGRDELDQRILNAVANSLRNHVARGIKQRYVSDQSRAGDARRESLDVDLLSCERRKREKVLIERGTYLAKDVCRHEHVLGDLIVRLCFVDIAASGANATRGGVYLGLSDSSLMKTEPAGRTDLGVKPPAASAGSGLTGDP